MNSSTPLSVIIITHNRPSLLDECLLSLKPQLKETDEIIIGINGKDKRTTQLLKKHKGLKVINFEEKLYPSTARNKLIKLSKNELLLFLDDDTLVPRKYILKGKRHFKQFNSDIFGGPDQTRPNTNFFERALGLSLSSPISTYKTMARHHRLKNKIHTATERDLILCNMWAKKTVFSSISFPDEYFRNEENVLLTNAKKLNLKISYIGDLFVFHKRKSNLGDLYKAVSRSAYFRMKSITNKESEDSIVFFMPALFIVYLITLILNFSLYLATPFFLFLFLNCFSSLTTIKKGKDLILFPLIYFLNIFIIISYGLGSFTYLPSLPLLGLSKSA